MTSLVNSKPLMKQLNKKVFLLVNGLVFLFIVSILSSEHIYYVFPSVLLLLTPLMWIYRSEYKKIISNTLVRQTSCVLFLYSGAIVLSAFYHGDAIPSSIKPELFAVLTIPILWLLCLSRIKQSIVCFALAIASALYGMVTIIDRFYYLSERGFLGYLPMSVLIPAAGIVMSIACMTMAWMFYLIEKQKYRQAFVVGCAALLGVLACILTGSRGAWLPLPFVVVFLIYTYRYYLGKYAKWSFILFFALISSMIAIPQVGIQQRVQEANYDIVNYFNGQDKNTSIGLRFEFWKTAIAKPSMQTVIIGHGEKNRDEYVRTLINEHVVIPEAFPIAHAHNQYLEIYYSRGFFGLIPMLCIFFVPLYYFCKFYRSQGITANQRFIAILGMILIFNSMLYGLSDMVLSLKISAMFLLMMLVILVALLYIEENENTVR